PVMDGLEAMRRIVAEPRGAPVKIIVHSASVLAHEMKEILSRGCDDFVAKPFREATVYAKTAELLGAVYEYEDAHRPPGRRVLLVDDEPISRELARTLLGGM